MICPECGGSTGVVDVRDKDDGSVRRRRICHDCGFRFSTTEAVNATADVVKATAPPEVVVIKVRAKPKRPTRSQIDRFLDVALKRY